MAFYSINNAITSYCDFIQRLIKRPGDKEIQDSLHIVRLYYRFYKENSQIYDEIKDYSQKLISSPEIDILFSFTEIEQVWSYLHLMIECCENKQINIWDRIRSMSDMKSFQEGIGKLWASKHKTVFTLFLKEKKTLPELNSDSSIKVIGLGGLGRHLLENMKQKNYAADTLLIHDDEMEAFKNKLQIYEPKGNLVFTRIGNDDHFVIVTSLAGKMCSTYLETILQNAKVSGKKIFIIGVLPFDFEGQSMKEISERNLNLIKKFSVKYTILSNENSFMKATASNISVKQLFDEIDEEIIANIDSINKTGVFL